MPELPEVETYVRDLEPVLRGRRVVDALCRWPRTIAQPDPDRFCSEIVGRRFDHFGRRGKYILLGLDSGETLIIHLRMTGEIRVRPDTDEVDQHTHLLLGLDDGHKLHYRDTRKFGRIWLVSDAETVVGKLGPEPLSDEFDGARLGAALRGRKAAIKGLLLNQTILAGVGNIYADEALFRAKIDPGRAGGSLNQDEIDRLVDAVRAVLYEGVEMRGSSLRDYAPPGEEGGTYQQSHQVFRRTGEPCFRCGAPIRRTIITQRSTHFCPSCQK